MLFALVFMVACLANLMSADRSTDVHLSFYIFPPLVFTVTIFCRGLTPLRSVFTINFWSPVSDHCSIVYVVYEVLVIALDFI